MARLFKEVNDRFTKEIEFYSKVSDVNEFKNQYTTERDVMQGRLDKADELFAKIESDFTDVR